MPFKDKEARRQYNKTNYAKKRDTILAQMKQHRDDNIELLKARRVETNIKRKLNNKKYMLRYNYDLSWEDYIAMLEKQDNKCAICRRGTKLMVDHCHATGMVRGLLCNPCNGFLGRMQENVQLIANIVIYLNV